MEQQEAVRVHPGIDAYPMQFSGTGGEYFRVWIVNVLLTVVTLGLYTPIARKRTAQWFWGHTVVAGTPLEFTAQQRKMVVGFLLLVVLYVAFKFAADTGQDAAVAVMMLAGAALAPYLWASAMRFRLNATRWRGVRLQFAAGWGEVYRDSWPVFGVALVWIAVALAATAILGSPGAAAPRRPPAGSVASFIGVLLVGLAATVLLLIRLEFNARSLLVRRGRIGGQDGRWKPVFGDFVRIWIGTIGVFLLSLLVVGVGAFAALAGTVAAARSGGSPMAGVLLVVAGFFVGVLLAILATGPARAYREARMFRLTWGNIGVSQVARFKCRLRVRSFVWLRIRNLLLTVLTLGFFRPFARVSEYRMKCESVTLHVKGSLDQLAGQLAREEEGLGDAIAAAAGLDLVS